jgi:hypothetical protein
MATIYNSDVTKELQRLCKIQINRDKVPNLLAEKIVPVVISNPKPTIKLSNKGTAGDFLTTSLFKRTFITSVQISGTSNSLTADGYVRVQMYDTEGALTTLCQLHISSGATTQNNDSVALVFDYPIEVRKGTAISLSASGITAYAGCITYYEEAD